MKIIFRSKLNNSPVVILIKTVNMSVHRVEFICVQTGQLIEPSIIESRDFKTLLKMKSDRVRHEHLLKKYSKIHLVGYSNWNALQGE